MKWRTLVLALLFSMLASAGWAQERWLYPPVDLEPEVAAELVEARRLLNQHLFEESIAIYLRISEEFQGTALGADTLEAARFLLALRGEEEVAEQLRQRIIAEYPGSRFEVRARFQVLEEEFSEAGLSETIRAYSDFLEEYGAPRLEGIMAGQGFEQAAQQISAIHPEIRFAIAWIFKGANSLTDDPQEVVNLNRFARATLESSAGHNLSFSPPLNHALQEWRGKEVGDEPSQPVVEILSPAPNSTVGSQPTISFRISAGDYRNEQVNVRNLSFKLDGAERALDALVLSELDDTLRENENFETLTLTLTPKLPAGTHTVEVFAHTGQRRQPENSTSVTWSFQVEDVPTLSEKRAIPASQDSIPSARDQISK